MYIKIYYSKNLITNQEKNRRPMLTPRNSGSLQNNFSQSLGKCFAPFEIETDMHIHPHQDIALLFAVQ